MAVSMTLNQLYAPTSVASHALMLPQGPSPKGPALASLPSHAPQQLDRMYQMSFSTPYAPQYPSSSLSTMQFHPLSKPGPSISDDYAADPLPFEYSRKYAPSHRDDVPAGLRGSVASGTSTGPLHFNDAFASHAIFAQPTPSQRQACYNQLPYPDPRGYAPSTEVNPVPRAQMYHPMGRGMKKDGNVYPPPSQPSVPRGSAGSTGTAQEAMIKVKTPLKLKYWRNGRRNLQCFPSCKVFGDYSAIKIEDLKQHDFMWGKCRGSLVTEVTLNRTMTLDDLILLGRVHSLENIPVAFEEAVIRECMLGRTVATHEMDTMKEQWILGERLPDFVPQDGNVACFEFKPKVWKYNEDVALGKCKRRNVKYYVQFEAFVPIVRGERDYYACIGSGMSTSFEVGSSRVLARQKRKAACRGPDDSPNRVYAVPPSSRQCSQAQPMMTHTGHHVLATHPMLPPSSTDRGTSRALPPTFPQSHLMMNQWHHMAPEMHFSLPQGDRLEPVVGVKRKMSSERPALSTDLSAKLVKTIPQSVPID